MCSLKQWRSSLRDKAVARVQSEEMAVKVLVIIMVVVMFMMMVEMCVSMESPSTRCCKALLTQALTSISAPASSKSSIIPVVAIACGYWWIDGAVW